MGSTHLGGCHAALAVITTLAVLSRCRRGTSLADVLLLAVVYEPGALGPSPDLIFVL